MCENITGQLILALKQNDYNSFVSLQNYINTVEQLQQIRDIVINLCQLNCDGLDLFYGFMVLNSFLNIIPVSGYTIIESVNEFKRKELQQLNDIMIKIYDFLKVLDQGCYQNYFPQAIIQIIKYLISIITSTQVQYIHEFMEQLIIQISKQDNLETPKFNFNTVLLYQLLNQVIRKYEYNEFSAEIYQINIQINYLLQNIDIADQKYQKILMELVKLLNLTYQGYGNQIDSEEFENKENDNKHNYKICLISQELKSYMNQYVGKILTFYYNNFDLFYETLFNVCCIVQINQRQTMNFNNEEVESCHYAYKDLLCGLILSNLNYMRYCIENSLYVNFSKAMYLTNEIIEHQNFNLYALTDTELEEFKNILVYIFQTVLMVNDSRINYMQLVLIFKKLLTIMQETTEKQDQLSESLQQSEGFTQQLYIVNQELNGQLFESLLMLKENNFLLQLMQLIDDNYIYQQLVNKLHDFKILLNIIYNNTDASKINELIDQELKKTQNNIYYIALLFNRFLTTEISSKLIQACFDIISNNINDFGNIIAIILSLQRLTQLYSLSDATQQQCIRIFQEYLSNNLIQQQLSKALLYCNNLTTEFIQYLQQTILIYSDPSSSQVISDEIFDLFCSKALIIYDTEQLSVVSGQFLQSYFNIRYIIAMTTNNSYQNVQYLEIPIANKQIVEQLTSIDVNSSANPCFILANFRQMVYKKYFHSFDKIAISYLTLLGDQQANYLCHFTSSQLVELLGLCKLIFPVLVFNNQEKNTYLDEDDIQMIRINMAALEAVVLFLHNTLLIFNYYQDNISFEEADEYLLDILAEVCYQLYLVKKSQYVEPILQWQFLQRLFVNNEHLAHGLEQISNIMLTMNQLGTNQYQQSQYLVSIAQSILNYSFSQFQYDRKYKAFISMMAQMKYQIEVFSTAIAQNVFFRGKRENNFIPGPQATKHIKQIFSQQFQVTDEAINNYPALLIDSVTREVTQYAFYIVEQISQQGASLQDKSEQDLYKEAYELIMRQQ